MVCPVVAAVMLRSNGSICFGPAPISAPSTPAPPLPLPPPPLLLLLLLPARDGGNRVVIPSSPGSDDVCPPLPPPPPDLSSTLSLPLPLSRLSVPSLSHPQTRLRPARTPARFQPVSRSMRSRMATTSRRSRASVRTSATMASDRIDTLATPRSPVCATMPHTWCAWCSCAVRMSAVSRGDTGFTCASRHCAVW